MSWVEAALWMWVGVVAVVSVLAAVRAVVEGREFKAYIAHTKEEQLRIEVLMKAMRAGALTPNEVRRELGLSPAAMSLLDRCPAILMSMSGVPLRCELAVHHTGSHVGDGSKPDALPPPPRSPRSRPEHKTV